MHQIKKYGLLLLALLFIFSCKKTDENTEYNVFKINSGSNSGFVYVFSPNMGYWSPVNENVNYVHLVFGDTDNLVVGGKDVMSVLFYDEGTGSVTIPSAQGQHCNIGVTINGAEEYYTAEDVKLTISEFTDTRLKGNISGSIISDGPEFEIVSFSMEIDIQMTEI